MCKLELFKIQYGLEGGLSIMQKIASSMDKPTLDGACISNEKFEKITLTGYSDYSYWVWTLTG